MFRFPFIYSFLRTMTPNFRGKCIIDYLKRLTDTCTDCRSLSIRSPLKNETGTLILELNSSIILNFVTLFSL